MIMDSDLNLLIDFGSPVVIKQTNSQANILAPLVPVPFVLESGHANCSLALTFSSIDVDNNPFDQVARQTDFNVGDKNDPFELVFKAAYGSQSTKISECDTLKEILHGSKSINKNDEEDGCETSGENVRIAHVENEAQEEEDSPAGTNILTKTCLTAEECLRNYTMNNHHINSEKCFPMNRLGHDSHVDINFKEDTLIENVTFEMSSLHILDNLSNLNITNDLLNRTVSVVQDSLCKNDVGLIEDTGTSSDQELKAIIADRVSRCIQNALNKSNQSTQVTELKCAPDFTLIADNLKAVPGKNHRRSLSCDLETLHHVDTIISLSPKVRHNTSTSSLDVEALRLSLQKIQRSWVPSTSDLSVDSGGSLNQGFLSTGSVSRPSQLVNPRVTNQLSSNNSVFNDAFLKSEGCAETKLPFNDSLGMCNILPNRKDSIVLKNGKNFIASSHSSFRHDDLERNILQHRWSSPCVRSISTDKSSCKTTLEHDGDDSVFLEAHYLSGVFSKKASNSNSSSDTDEISNIKPEWETSSYELPKFDAEVDGYCAVEEMNQGKTCGTEEVIHGFKHESNADRQHIQSFDAATLQQVNNEKHEDGSLTTRGQVSCTKKDRFKCFSVKSQSNCKEKDEGESFSASSQISCKEKDGGESLSNYPEIPPNVTNPPQGFWQQNGPGNMVPSSAVVVGSDETQKRVLLRPKKMTGQSQIGCKGPLKAIIPLGKMTRAIPNKGMKMMSGKVMPLPLATPKNQSTDSLPPLTISTQDNGNMKHITESPRCLKSAANPKRLVSCKAYENPQGASSRANLSLTSPSSIPYSGLPVLRRANSLTSSIPSLIPSRSSYGNTSTPTRGRKTSDLEYITSPIFPIPLSNKKISPARGGKQAKSPPQAIGHTRAKSASNIQALKNKSPSELPSKPLVVKDPNASVGDNHRKLKPFSQLITRVKRSNSVATGKENILLV